MKNLRHLRETKKMTMKALGQEIGVAESTISLYETGKREPDNATIIRLADFFHVSIDYLLGLTDDPCFSGGPLAAFIRERRGEESEESFAHRCGISVYLLRRIEEGFRKIDTGDLSNQINSLSAEDEVKIAKALNVSWKYIAALYAGYNPHKINGIEAIPADDRTENLAHQTLHNAKNAAYNISEQDRLLLYAYHVASPADRDVIDNIVGRYTKPRSGEKAM